MSSNNTSKVRSLGTDEWPSCLNCGHLTLSDGTCVNRECLRDRLDEALVVHHAHHTHQESACRAA